MCNHEDMKVVGEWKPYKLDIPLLVRECPICGAIHLGNGPNCYEPSDHQPHWNLDK